MTFLSRSVTVGLSLLLAGSTVAQADFDLSWFTIDGGGAMYSTGGTLELGGTIGQPDAGVVLTGGNFDLTGGFWTVTARLLGDMNCDGVVNFDDINPFIDALSDPAFYHQMYPNCEILNADCNSDGLVDFSDINPFIDVLSGG